MEILSYRMIEEKRDHVTNVPCCDKTWFSAVDRTYGYER